VDYTAAWKAAAKNLSCLTARGSWPTGSGYLTSRADGDVEGECFSSGRRIFFAIFQLRIV